jgi:hypothetical protein
MLRGNTAWSVSAVFVLVLALIARVPKWGTKSKELLRKGVEEKTP